MGDGIGGGHGHWHGHGPRYVWGFSSVPSRPNRANIVCYKINDPHFVFKCYRNDCQYTGSWQAYGQNMGLVYGLPTINTQIFVAKSQRTWKLISRQPIKVRCQVAYDGNKSLIAESEKLSFLLQGRGSTCRRTLSHVPRGV